MTMHQGCCHTGWGDSDRTAERAGLQAAAVADGAPQVQLGECLH